jgi:hypothetical protein
VFSLSKDKYKLCDIKKHTLKKDKFLSEIIKKEPKLKEIINDSLKNKDLLYGIKKNKLLKSIYIFKLNIDEEDKKNLIFSKYISCEKVPVKEKEKLESYITLELKEYVNLEEYNSVTWNDLKIEAITIQIGKHTLHVSTLVILLWSLTGAIGTLIGYIYDKSTITILGWFIGLLIAFISGILLNKNRKE